jgi:hypothetical protein
MAVKTSDSEAGEKESSTGGGIAVIGSEEGFIVEVGKARQSLDILFSKKLRKDKARVEVETEGGKDGVEFRERRELRVDQRRRGLFLFFAIRVRKWMRRAVVMSLETRRAWFLKLTRSEGSLVLR